MNVPGADMKQSKLSRYCYCQTETYGPAWCLGQVKAKL